MFSRRRERCSHVGMGVFLIKSKNKRMELTKELELKLMDELERQLKTIPDLVGDEGIVKKWVVIHRAQNHDTELIELLLDCAPLKAKFFKEIKGALVFDQRLFVDFWSRKTTSTTVIPATKTRSA